MEEEDDESIRSSTNNSDDDDEDNPTPIGIDQQSSSSSSSEEEYSSSSNNDDDDDDDDDDYEYDLEDDDSHESIPDLIERADSVESDSDTDNNEGEDFIVRGRRTDYNLVSELAAAGFRHHRHRNNNNNNNDDENKEENQQKEKEYITTMQIFIKLYQEYKLQLTALELDEAEKNGGEETTKMTTRCCLLQALDAAALKIEKEEKEEKEEEGEKEKAKMKEEEEEENEGEEKMAASSSPAATQNSTESLPSSPSLQSTVPNENTTTDTSSSSSLQSVHHYHHNYPKVSIHSDNPNRTGILQRYNPKSDKFEIILDKKQKGTDNNRQNDDIVNVKHCNLTLLPPYHSNKEDNNNSPPPPKWFQSLFRIGTKYVGSIQIPNLNSSDHDSDSLHDKEHNDANEKSRQKYVLVILSHEFQETKKEEEEEEEGWKPPILVARHCAYGDEQYVRVVIRLISSSSSSSSKNNEEMNKTEEKTIEIEYADGETRCLGSFSPTLGTFQGNVWQLMAGEEGSGNNNFLSDNGGEGGGGSNKMSGVYYPREDATHTFVLRPCGFGYPKGVNLSENDAKKKERSENEMMTEENDKKKDTAEATDSDNDNTDNYLQSSTLQKILLSPQSLSLTKQRFHLNTLSIQLNNYIRTETFKSAVQFMTSKQRQQQQLQQEEGEDSTMDINSSAYPPMTLSGATSGLHSTNNTFLPLSVEATRRNNMIQRIRDRMQRHHHHHHHHRHNTQQQQEAEENEENKQVLQKLLTNLSQIQWSQILIENAVQCTEYTCCNFRWFALLLDVQTFDGVVEKFDFIQTIRQDDDDNDDDGTSADEKENESEEEKKKRGGKRKIISLTKAHREWENNCTSVNIIFYCWKQFSESTSNITTSHSFFNSEEEEDQHKFVIAIHQTRHRLLKNYSILDGAWKRMEKRATEEDIGRWTCRDCKKDQKENEIEEEKGGKNRGWRDALSSRWKRSHRKQDSEAMEESDDTTHVTDTNMNNTDSQKMSEQEEEEEVCAICYESVIPTTTTDNENANNSTTTTSSSDKKKICKNKNYPLYLPCGHSFHSLCIRDWFHNHTICPVCRFQLDLLPMPTTK